MPTRKTVADLVALRSEFAERRRVAAYRATEGHDRGLLDDAIAAHAVVEALDAVIAEGGDGLDVDTPDDGLQTWAALGR